MEEKVVEVVVHETTTRKLLKVMYEDCNSQKFVKEYLDGHREDSIAEYPTSSDEYIWHPIKTKNPWSVPLDQLDQYKQHIKFYDVYMVPSSESADKEHSTMNRFITSHSEIKSFIDHITDNIHFPIMDKGNPCRYTLTDDIYIGSDHYLVDEPQHITFKNKAELLAIKKHIIGPMGDTIQLKDGAYKSFRCEGGEVYHALFKCNNKYYACLKATLKNVQLKTPGFWITLGDNTAIFPYTINYKMQDTEQGQKQEQVFYLKNYLWIIDEVYNNESIAQLIIDDDDAPSLYSFWMNLYLNGI